MEITTLLDIHSREELYHWYQENHDKATDFWLRINRAEADCPGVVRYVDAVEVALCFGWIDSTMKRIGGGCAIAIGHPAHIGRLQIHERIQLMKRLSFWLPIRSIAFLLVKEKAVLLR